MNTIDISGEWEQVADRIKQDTKTSVVMCIVIGKIDSGKRAFCKYLTNTWTASGIHIGYVDSDLGQSTMGPPTTVGLKIFNRYKAYFKSAKVVDCFIHKVVLPSCIIGTGKRVNPYSITL